MARFLVGMWLFCADTLGRLVMNIKFIVSGLVLAVGLGVGMIEGEKLMGAFSVVANASAKINCTCVFVAERELDQCMKDLPQGFDLAQAFVERESKTVQSSVYWVVRGAARFQATQGCSLE